MGAKVHILSVGENKGSDVRYRKILHKPHFGQTDRRKGFRHLPFQVMLDPLNS